jgi:hypothetical protein
VLLWGNVPTDEWQRLARRFEGQLAVSALYDHFSEGARPYQARFILTRLVALQRRYRDGLIAVGFRSTTLEGAALLGIPSFSFDDTTATHFASCYQDGLYLVDARYDAELHERGLTLARDINTFIRINIRAGAGQRNLDGGLVLDEQALADLMTAIRTWTPRVISGARRNWAVRAHLCRSGLARLHFAAVREQCRADARRIEP